MTTALGDGPGGRGPMPERPAAQPQLGRGTGLALTAWSALGLAASFTLATDKVRILEDPTFEPACNFNPVLSCGSVMVTPQAEVLGFPNPFLGLVGFSVLMTLGVLAVSRVLVPRWVVAGAAAGSLLGAAFVHWLAFQSLYRIGALCPWCLVVWAVTIPIALWLTLALAAHHARGTRSARVVAVAWQWRFTLVAGWYLLVVVLSLERFWDYWSTLL